MRKRIVEPPGGEIEVLGTEDVPSRAEQLPRAGALERRFERAIRIGDPHSREDRRVQEQAEGGSRPRLGTGRVCAGARVGGRLQVQHSDLRIGERQARSPEKGFGRLPVLELRDPGPGVLHSGLEITLSDRCATRQKPQLGAIA